VMAVLKPLKVVIDNYSDQTSEELDAVNNPEDPSAGTRSIPFSRTLYIERDDFLEDPPKEFFRLAPGREVRLRYAYIIKCVGVTKDPRTGEVTELHCTYDPETKSGGPQARRKVKATIHWVSAVHAVEAEVRLYNPLLKADFSSMPGDEDWTAHLNPQSLERLTGCQVEPSLRAATPGSRFQFERLGYFCVDPDSSPDQPVFNRTVSLKDAWARLDKRQPPR
jgi:glutaminyl-tRNA synthetase